MWAQGHHGDVVGAHRLPVGVGVHHRRRHTTSCWPTSRSGCARPRGTLALDFATPRLERVVLDGPLNRIWALRPAGHRLREVPRQADPRRRRPRRRSGACRWGARTRIRTAGADRYTCYLRVGAARPAQSRWTGIARLEFPAAAGLDAVIARADQLAFHLPPLRRRPAPRPAGPRSTSRR